jgi:hypothetical protein
MISLMFFYLKQRQAFKKPLEVSPNHFQMEKLANKELIARPPCFRDVLQPPITDSLLFASL